MCNSEKAKVSNLNYHREYIFKKIILIFISIVLFVNSIQPFFIIIAQIPQDVKVIFTHSIEQVKINQYGECNAIGYGYIKKIVSTIPDTNLFPVVRYSTYNLFPFVLFPDSRLGNDDKILIGIDFGPEATDEAVITHAKQSSVNSNASKSQWIFHTTLDYEILTGFSFSFKNIVPLQEQTLNVTLYDSEMNFVEIGHWVIPLSNQQKSPLLFNLEKPIRNFSINRGSTDFILVIESTGINNSPAIEIADISVLGIKIDLSDYMIFHRGQAHNERCFAAIKKSFYQEIYDNNLVEWKKYLEVVANVRRIK
jgi:hypothetical protein